MFCLVITLRALKRVKTRYKLMTSVKIKALIIHRLNIVYTFKKNTQRVGQFHRKHKYAVLWLYCQFTFSGFFSYFSLCSWRRNDVKQVFSFSQNSVKLSRAQYYCILRSTKKDWTDESGSRTAAYTKWHLRCANLPRRKNSAWNRVRKTFNRLEHILFCRIAKLLNLVEKF